MQHFLSPAATRACLFLVPLFAVAGASAQSVDGPAVDVTVASLADITIADRRTVSAEVSPRHRAVLAAEVAGRIVGLDVDVGDSMDSGNVLVRIDPTLYELAARRAEAELASVEAEIERARSRLARIEALANKDYASADELQVESTSLAVLERTREIRRVARDQARVELARTRVLAPFDGFIESRDGQLGNYVAPGTPLLTVVQGTERRILADLHPNQASSIQSARSVRFVSASGTSELEVARVSPVVDPVSRMQTVRLTFVGDTRPPVGEVGELRWRSEGGLIPADFVLQRNGELGVFVVDNDTATFVVLAGANPGRPAAHTLSDTARVIVDGRQRVRDGTPVRVLER